MSVETFGSKWVSVKHKILKSEKLSSIKSSLFLILLIFKPMARFQNNFTDIFLGRPSTDIAKIVPLG